MEVTGRERRRPLRSRARGGRRGLLEEEEDADEESPASHLSAVAVAPSLSFGPPPSEESGCPRRRAHRAGLPPIDSRLWQGAWPLRRGAGEAVGGSASTLCGSGGNGGAEREVGGPGGVRGGGGGGRERVVDSEATPRAAGYRRRGPLPRPGQPRALRGSRRRPPTLHPPRTGRGGGGLRTLAPKTNPETHTKEETFLIPK